MTTIPIEMTSRHMGVMFKHDERPGVGRPVLPATFGFNGF